MTNTLKVLFVGPRKSCDPVRNALLARKQASFLCIAESESELQLIPGAQAFEIIILDSSIPENIMRRIAEYVRRILPVAKILLVGNDPDILEDQLYDERMTHETCQEDLLVTIERLIVKHTSQTTGTLCSPQSPAGVEER